MKLNIKESMWKVSWYVKDNSATYAHWDDMLVEAGSEAEALQVADERIVDEFDYGLSDVERMWATPYPDNARYNYGESKIRKSRSRKLKEVYTHGLRVYEGWDNFQNYIFVWDLNRADNDTRIVDWDLSDDEVYDLAKRIYEGEYNIEDNSVGGDWESWDSVISGMHGFREISDEEISED